MPPIIYSSSFEKELGFWIQITICHGRMIYPNGTVIMWINREKGKTANKTKKFSTCNWIIQGSGETSEGRGWKLRIDPI
jgi:hypothetical protein